MMFETLTLTPFCLKKTGERKQYFKALAKCALPVADLFLFCYERDFMMSLPDDKQADIFDAFNIWTIF